MLDLDRTSGRHQDADHVDADVVGVAVVEAQPPRSQPPEAVGLALVDRDGNLYVGADDDFVYSLEPGGRMRWFARTGANVDGEPILTPEGLLLVGSDDNHLHAIGARPSE